MSFLLGVAGGFGQALADDQRDKNEWLRNQKLMNKRYAMTTGTASLKKAQEERDAVLRQADYIQKRGISKSSLMYLWDEGGVNAISDIYDLIQNTHKDATKEEINNLANAAKDYAVNENRSFADVLSKSRGLYSQEMPETKEQTALQKIFGDPTNEAFYDDGTKYEGGYTITDMYRIQGAGFGGGKGSVVFDTDAAPMKRSPQYDATTQRNVLATSEIQLGKSLIRMRNDLGDPEKYETYKRILEDATATDNYIEALNIEELRPYTLSILKPYVDAEKSVRGAVINNNLFGSNIKETIQQIVYPVKKELIALDKTQIQKQINDEIDTAIKLNQTTLTKNELKNLPVYTQKDLNDMKNNNVRPQSTYFFNDEKGNIELMLPPPVKEERITKEETVDKLITGQDSSDDILPYTITKEQWNKLPRYARRNYAEATGGNYTPLARFVGFFTGSNTLTTDEAINSVNKRLQLDPNKSYYVKSPMNPERIMKGSLIQRIDVEHFANPRDGIIIKRQATNEEIQEANGFKIKSNRPWNETDFMKAFSNLLKK